jgi:glycosyltransferase involved in cell wall biosynthesis
MQDGDAILTVAEHGANQSNTGESMPDIKSPLKTHALIIAVLESYEYVRRQLLWLNKFMPDFPQWEVIFVDDGSDPEIPFMDGLNFTYRLFRTHDKRDWSQPCARNFGAKNTAAKYLLFTDIDHMISCAAIQACSVFDGDKLHFQRIRGILDEFGGLRLDRKSLDAAGCTEDEFSRVDEHYNTFMIRRSVFDLLNGYDEKFCGKYGGDDTDFSNRYGALHAQGKCKRSVGKAALIYVAPCPKEDRAELFHGIRRRTVAERREREKQNGK